MICGCTWCWIKGILAVWLIHPEYRVNTLLIKGALFIEQKSEKYLNLAHSKSNEILGE